MKLNKTLEAIERSGDFEETIACSIGNDTFIMGLLQDKIYSNALYSCVQEYVSNARDANREAGNHKAPVEITMPSSVNGYMFSVSDSGIGIDDKRIKIFAGYGLSTKRSSNDQTGGFGLGCKVGWSYHTKMFTLDTVFVDADGTKTNKVYVCQLNEMMRSEINLAYTKKNVDRQTGTKVSFAIKRNDTEECRKSVLRVCNQWDVHPIIKGDDRLVFKRKVAVQDTLLSDKHWFFTENENYRGYGRSICFVDGIEYEVNTSSLDSNAGEFLSSNTSCIFNFDIGQVDLVVSRDSLSYTDRTKKAFADIHKQLVDKVTKEIKPKIKLAKSLCEAEIIVGKVSRFINTKDLEWKGNKLLGTTDLFHRKDDMLKNEIIRSIFARKLQKDRYNLTGISCQVSGIFNVKLDSLVVIDDKPEKNLSKLRLSKLLEDYPDRSIYIIQNGKYSYIDDPIAEVLQYDRLKQCETVMLSSVEKISKASAAKRNYGVTKSYKLSYSFDWTQDDIDLKEYEGFYIETYKYDSVWKGQELPTRQVYDLAIQLGIIKSKSEIIGVPSRFVPSMNGKSKPLVDEILKEVKKQGVKKYGEVRVLYGKIGILESMIHGNLKTWLQLANTFFGNKSVQSLAPVSYSIFKSQKTTKELYSEKSNISLLVQKFTDNTGISIPVDEKGFKSATSQMQKEIQEIEEEYKKIKEKMILIDLVKLTMWTDEQMKHYLSLVFKD